MRLLLARHAPTDWNSEGRYQGQRDIELGPRGRRLAGLLARRLAAERIDHVHCSDLRRAHETASIVSEKRGLSVVADARLRELCFGAWEGLSHDEIRRRYPQELAAWEADPLRVAPAGGETLAQLAERVGAFLADRTRDAGPDRTVLVVGHRGSLQVLLCLALGLPVEFRWKFWIAPASLSELRLDAGVGVLNFLNDTHHLQEADHDR
jgi:alpha-ribazole phosphatase